MDTTDEAQLRKAAVRRVDARFGFLIHAVIYLTVNGAMVISGEIAGQLTPAFLWCAGAWTLALLIQGVGVFVDAPALRRRAIEAELERLRAAAR